MRKSKIIIFSFFMALCTIRGFAQLSDLHYLPPLKQNSAAIVDQVIYVSTPEATAFTVDVYRGNSATKLTTLTVSKAASTMYALPTGDNDITFVTAANTGTKLSNSGLRFVSPGGQKFYVNYRGKSGSQASSLTSKGRAALGKAFKWGGVPNKGTNYSIMNSTLGIMATEDNTTFRIFGYNPSCTFRLGANATGITDDAITITLNAGQSYVLEATIAAANSPNMDGWLGASITSDKNIAVSFGELHYQPMAVGNQDCAIDQIIPENTLGREYVFVRGNGVDGLEFPVIVATQNDTKIYVNGGATPVATINNGDYFSIPSTYYSTSSTTSSVPGGNMYVYTSKEAYAFQSLAGSSGTLTGDINFIAPVNCLLSSQVDGIPDITNMAGIGISGGVTIIASTTVADADIIVKYGTNQVSYATMVAAKKTVSGSTNWKTYFLPGLSGNVSVSANGPIAVGFFGYSGAIGASGYFSGFETIPTIQLTKVGDGCLPSTILTATPGFSSYAWYKDGILIPSVTTNSYTPTTVGNYKVVVSQGSCTYESSFEPVNDCRPEVVYSVTADNNTVASNSTVTFKVAVKYYGYDKVDNVLISNTLPSVVTLTSATPTFGTWNATNKQWTIGTMYPGEEHILTVKATVNSVVTPTNGTYTITSTQTFSGTEGNSIPDDLSETITAVAALTSPGLSNFSFQNKKYFDNDFTIAPPTSNSSGAITYTSSNPSVATVKGNVISIHGSGTSSIVASQAANGSYYSGTIAATLTVTDVSVLTSYGRIVNNLPNYVNKNGAIGASQMVDSKGKAISLKSNDGSSSSSAGTSAQQIKTDFPSSVDGVYWIDLPNVGPTQIYCLMDSNYDGGGWMLAMKAAAGTTFNYSSSYWTTANTLNPTDVTRNSGDAKYETMNNFQSKDLMAIWPDISNIGSESGSIDGLTKWTWLQNNFHGSDLRTTLISKFAGSQDTYYTSTNGTMTFLGYNTSVFSKQQGFTFYGINYSGNANAKVRWGFGWNNEADQTSNDVSGGIGMSLNYGNYSAGDYYWSGATSLGINKSARIEIYIR